MKMPETLRKILFNDAFILIAILFVVGICWYYSWHWIDANVPGEGSTSAAEVRGQFGDKFGAINSLFSGFAFAAIIFTIVLQNRELSNTKKTIQEQSKAVDSQRFDAAFFQLLNLHNDITDKLNNLHHEGRQSFLAFNERVIVSDPDFAAFCGLSKLQRDQVRSVRDASLRGGANFLDAYKDVLADADVSNILQALTGGVACCDNYLDDTLQLHEKKIKAAYTTAALAHIDKYSHYFRNLYHILKFVKESPLIDDDERKRYAKILRSQLSEVELIALFYNSITEIKLPGREQVELGYPKMGKLLVEFDILQNLSPRSMIHSLHREIFKKNNGDLK